MRPALLPLTIEHVHVLPAGTRRRPHTRQRRASGGDSMLSGVSSVNGVPVPRPQDTLNAARPGDSLHDTVRAVHRGRAVARDAWASPKARPRTTRQPLPRAPLAGASNGVATTKPPGAAESGVGSAPPVSEPRLAGVTQLSLPMPDPSTGAAAGTEGDGWVTPPPPRPTLPLPLPRPVMGPSPATVARREAWAQLAKQRAERVALQAQLPQMKVRGSVAKYRTAGP